MDIRTMYLFGSGLDHFGYDHGNDYDYNHEYNNEYNYDVDYAGKHDLDVSFDTIFGSSPVVNLAAIADVAGVAFNAISVAAGTFTDAVTDAGPAIAHAVATFENGIADAQSALDSGWPMDDLGIPGTVLPMPEALPQIAFNAYPVVVHHVADLAQMLEALPVDAIADAFDHWQNWQSWLLPMSNPVITA